MRWLSRCEAGASRGADPTSALCARVDVGRDACFGEKQARSCVWRRRPLIVRCGRLPRALGDDCLVRKAEATLCGSARTRCPSRGGQRSVLLASGGDATRALLGLLELVTHIDRGGELPRLELLLGSLDARRALLFV